MTTRTPRRSLSDAVRRPAPAAIIDAAAQPAPTSLATTPALTPEAFEPVRALSTLADIRSAIDDTTDPAELLDVAAQTSAIQGWLSHQRRGAAVANAARATTLTAERRLGRVLADLERTPGRRDGDSPYRAVLKDLDLEPRTVRRWAELARIADATFDEYIEQAAAGEMTSGYITENGLRRFADRPAPPANAPAPAARSTKAPEPDLRAAALAALGAIDFEPAANDASDPESWRGRAWAEPRAADLHEWVTLCVQAWGESRLQAAVIRVPVQPDAEWWALLAGNPICLLRREVAAAAAKPGARPQSRDRTSGAVIGVGVPAADFASAFADLGWVYTGA